MFWLEEKGATFVVQNFDIKIKVQFKKWTMPSSNPQYNFIMLRYQKLGGGGGVILPPPPLPTPMTYKLAR